MATINKPGTAARATVAFIVLNLPLWVTVSAVYYLSGGPSAEWWVRGILAVAVAVSQFAIVTTTIGPPMLDWINSSEYVKDGEKPSWERK